MRRKIRHVFTTSLAVTAVIAAFQFQPAYATDKAPETLAVCEDQRLNLIAPDGSRLSTDEIELAATQIQAYCNDDYVDSSAPDQSGGGLVQPFGIAHGGYVTNAAEVTCICSDRKSFVVEANAHGVPYNGEDLWKLGLIWRVQPGGTGAWNSGGAVYVTTYGFTPETRGSMSLSNHVESIASLYTPQNTLVESIIAVGD